MDMFCILPFDLLCLHFDFSSVYRLNRIARVGGRGLFLAPQHTLGTQPQSCPLFRPHLCVSRSSPSSISATGWRASWPRPTSGGAGAAPQTREIKYLSHGIFFSFFRRTSSMIDSRVLCSCRVARTTGYLLYMLHLNACAYFVASVHQGLASTSWVYDGEGTAYVQSLLFVAAVGERVSKGNYCKRHTTCAFTEFNLSSAGRFSDEAQQKWKLK